MMPLPDLLDTKFFLPSIRPDLVSRPRLIKQLNEGLQGNLTLISAPAGFGKTTLASSWARQLLDGVRRSPTAYRLAWLSLDEDDNDPRRFLTYLISALMKANPSDPPIGDAAMGMLADQPVPPAEVILTSLINSFSAIPGRIVLVLDDFHVIESPAIDAALGFLLDHLPPPLHLVLVTRIDPQLPLAQMRACNQLHELRGSDLRFTPRESADFLNRTMGLDLPEEAIERLEARTEGWIAGLQLAAVSIRSQTDPLAFIRSFSGSHRFVLEYLLEEVLEQRPAGTRDFLLQTSILERFTAPLCDAVIDHAGSEAIIHALNQANLFILPLDDEGRWYRYHQLFTDLLGQRLRQAQPGIVPELHLRASAWFAEHGFTELAIRHALSAGEDDRAAALAEQAWREMHMSYGGVDWLRWVQPIPDEVVRSRPVISIGYGWSLLDTGDLQGADRRLIDAERWIDSQAAEQDGAEIDEKAMRSMRGSIANARAYRAQALGDVKATMAFTRQALRVLPEDDYFERSLSAILPGFAHWADGELDKAHADISRAIEYMRTLDKLPFVISFTTYLADVMIAQGRLNEAREHYRQLLDAANRAGVPDLPETSVVHFGLSEILHEQGELQAARRHLAQGEQLGELPTFPPWHRRRVLARMRLLEADGDVDGEIKLLEGARRLYYRHPIPDVRPLSALIARAQLAAGNLTAALRWVSENSLAPDDATQYLHEYEHLTLVRVLIAAHQQDPAGGSLERAAALLARLLEAAEQGGRTGSEIEILALRAVALRALGKLPAAMEALERALGLAEPEGYVHTFAAEGAAMGDLLPRISMKEPRMGAYVRRVLGAFEGGRHETPGDQLLVEPLSEREIEVLQLLAQGLTNREIAAALYLSLNTVKVHTRNIYGKLAVRNRTQAVARARELGILSSA